jgi:hypothetical protein
MHPGVETPCPLMRVDFKEGSAIDAWREKVMRFRN